MDIQKRQIVFNPCVENSAGSRDDNARAKIVFHDHPCRDIRIGVPTGDRGSELPEKAEASRVKLEETGTGGGGHQQYVSLRKTHSRCSTAGSAGVVVANIIASARLKGSS